MEWVIIEKNQPIGAVGFIEDKAVAIVAFYDDRDGNKDGKVSFMERLGARLSPISISGSSIAEVAMQARVEPDVIGRDPSFALEATNIFLSFAHGVVRDGFYAVYFARGVSMTGKGLAKMITTSDVKGFVIREGFEGAVKSAFEAATDS